MTFPYRRYQVKSANGIAPKVVHRPAIPIGLVGPASHIRLIALVDTGADHTVFPRWAADQVGIDVDDSTSLEIAGIGGQRFPSPAGEVIIQISDHTQTYRWASVVRFASLPAPQSQLAVLGREGCLSFFTATFEGDRRLIDLVPNNTFPAQ